MAFILLVNPDGSQAPAIARLTRELSEHELVSAGSCADALSAVGSRVPDLLLLSPLLPETEEAELRSRFDTVSGTVCALTLPLLTPDGPAAAGASTDRFGLFRASAEQLPSGACDPGVFADMVREYLGDSPGTAHQSAAPVHRPIERDPFEERRTHVRAAAVAAVSWIHARRAAWAEAPLRMDIQVAPLPPAAVAAPAIKPRRAKAPAPVRVSEPPPPPPVPIRPYEPEPAYVPAPAYVNAPPYEPAATYTADQEPFASDPNPGYEPEETLPARPRREWHIAATAGSALESIKPWLPRIAVVVVLLTLAAAGRAYWPTMRGAMTNGTAVFESVPPGSEISIDGHPAGAAPLTVELPAGAHTVEFRNGTSTRTMQMVVVARGRIVERLDWTAKPIGSLRVSSDPAGARVLVDGKASGTTPLKLDGLPAGAHAVTIESKAGSVRRTVTIVAGETAELNELIFAGSLTVFAPFEVQVSEGRATLQLDERGQIALPPGLHKVRFQNRTLGYDETRSVEVSSGTTTRLSLVPKPTTISVTATEPSDVWIDGTRAGPTPLAGFSLALGTREVIVKTAAGLQRRFVVTATVAPMNLEADFTKPQF